jgi:hypothetical protein
MICGSHNPGAGECAAAVAPAAVPFSLESTPSSSSEYTLHTVSIRYSCLVVVAFSECAIECSFPFHHPPLPCSNWGGHTVLLASLGVRHSTPWGSALTLFCACVRTGTTGSARSKAGARLPVGVGTSLGASSLVLLAVSCFLWRRRRRQRCCCCLKGPSVLGTPLRPRH